MLLPARGGTGNIFLDSRPGIKPSPSISFGENFSMMIVGAGISRNFLEEVIPELGLARERGFELASRRSLAPIIGDCAVMTGRGGQAVGSHEKF